MNTTFDRIVLSRIEGIAREVLGKSASANASVEDYHTMHTFWVAGYKAAFKLAVKEFEEILLLEYDGNTDGVQETVRLFKKRMLLFHTEYPTKDIEL